MRLDELEHAEVALIVFAKEFFVFADERAFGSADYFRMLKHDAWTVDAGHLHAFDRVRARGYIRPILSRVEIPRVPAISAYR